MRWVIAIMCASLLPSLASAQDGAVPEPVVPVCTKLKDLHLTTALVSGGKPAVTIVAPAAYAAEGRSLQETIREVTGVTVPVVADTAPEAALPLRANLPLQANLILLGNRSTNRTIAGLYDCAYTFLDLKYPGPGGFVVRSLHSPFGDGRNVLFAGGSDLAGVQAATAALRDLLRAAGGKPGDLAVGYLCRLKLSPDYTIPDDLKQVEIWEASRMYGSSGYFGWNMVSKNMALYYMTGEEKYLREFLRLAFPDAAAIKEIEDYDGERIETKADPLAGPYHYAAHMMVELWDLIEESPALTDAQRLRVTNSLARQLTHRVVEGVYGATAPGTCVGDRHADWSAFALYVLGRYFNRDYPAPVWQRCLQAADQYFSTLTRTYWMAGYNDHLFWFTSYYDPMLNYLLLSGKREPAMLQNLRRALESQEVLSTGLESDWGVQASSLSMLGKAAYILGDGRWLYFRERTGLNTDVFRLGQSFWPGPELPVAAPTDLVNKWTIHWMPEDMRKARATGFAADQSFRWGSYRSELGSGGDYLLLDGYNGAGRNPYHTFDVLELRLGGATLLKGYHNQVLSSADGMVEPQVAMDGALLHHDVTGGTVAAVAEVPKLPFATWRRSLAQRVGRYALIVDDLGFRTDSDNLKLETTWEMPGATWQPRQQCARTRAYASTAVPEGWLSFPALQAECTCGPATPAELLSRLQSLDIVLLKAPGPGAWMELPFTLPQAVSGELFADLLNYEDRGIVRLLLDGRQTGEEIDHWSPGVATQRVSLGRHDLAAGAHRLRLEVVGKRPESKRHYAGLIGVKLQPEGAAAAVPQVVYELHPSELLDVTGGAVTTMVWRGAVRSGEHRAFFHLLGRNAAGTDGALAALRLADNAAALALPEAAVAAVGEYRGLKGELAVLSEKTLYGHRLRSAGLEQPLLTADTPVEADWDFERGVLTVVNASPTKLSLALQSPQVTLNGKPVSGTTEGGLVSLRLAAGRQELRGATPSTGVWKPLTASLPGLLEQARAARTRQVAAAGAAPPALPALTPAMQASLDGAPVEAVVIPGPQGDLLCTATGKTVALLAPEGKVVRRLTTAGEVRALRWWAEPRLLLVGCADEKVVAFDEQGVRKWEFTSVMDQAVYEAGKQYWFKSAHPGIYGLYSGAFDGGRSRAFVGSACTLEILDEQGQLVKRLPVFWGPGRQFLLVKAADGTPNLLVARWHNDGHALAIVSSTKLADVGHGYDGVPAGHTYVAGWDCMNRYDNYLTDLDGNGTREVVSAINGTWNRVTIYSEDGTPLYNAQFGSGTPEPRANLRQMDVGDLNADGKQEIVVATSAGLVVVLDSQARKVWATPTASAPTVVRVMDGRVLAGCEDGTVVALDARGKPTAQGKLHGRPVDLRVLQTPQGPLGVFTTSQGEVAGYRLP